MNNLEIEAKIASNLIVLAGDLGKPVPFCQAGIDDLMSGTIEDMARRTNDMHRIRRSLHEVLYAPPVRG